MICYVEGECLYTPLIYLLCSIEVLQVGRERLPVF